MKLTLINIDSTDPNNIVKHRYPTEPCPANYFAGFDNAPVLQFCYKPVDKLILSMLGTKKYLSFLFEDDCKFGALCNGPIMNAAFSAFTSYFLTHTFTYYFTTRYLDENNNVKFSVN
jgi:hypothetical protein